MNSILQQAIEHIPALLFIWFAVFAAYWASWDREFSKVRTPEWGARKMDQHRH